MKFGGWQSGMDKDCSVAEVRNICNVMANALGMMKMFDWRKLQKEGNQKINKRGYKKLFK